ncbi:MAG: hypothetical protein IT204_25310 [Fimbriimonadaceae bacterium]|nr:hypothetical protein [Fimbriimonadaceae bacterium]
MKRLTVLKALLALTWSIGPTLAASQVSGSASVVTNQGTKLKGTAGQAYALVGALVAVQFAGAPNEVSIELSGHIDDSYMGQKDGLSTTVETPPQGFQFGWDLTLLTTLGKSLDQEGNYTSHAEGETVVAITDNGVPGTPIVYSASHTTDYSVVGEQGGGGPEDPPGGGVGDGLVLGPEDLS